MMDFLEGKAREIAERALAEESAKRRHVVIALSGAHAYGFPSPDSDLDLKAIHIAKSEKFLGFEKLQQAYDRLEVIEGVEIDYTSNELSSVLAQMASGNGNYIERIGGNLICQTSSWHAELREMLPQMISKRVHRHYRGFASNQRKAFEEADKPTAKKLLYVLRTALTGTHLLRTGELRVDLNTTAEEYGYGEAEELIVAKRQGEKTVLPEEERQRWLGRLDSLFELLDQARDESPLPEEADMAAIEGWLVATRKRELC